jgi:AcrR family transcriptional regulator
VSRPYAAGVSTASPEGAPDGRALRWAGHREARRVAIVEAAIEAIEEVGPGATVEQVAARLGVTRQVVYRQFADRADLDAAVAEEAARRLVDDLLPALALSTDVPSAVRGALVAYLDHVEAHLPLYRFVRAHDSGTAEGSVARVKSTVVSRVAGLARDYLVDAGLAGAKQAQAFATGCVGMADAVVSGWLDDPGTVSREQLVDTLTVMIMGVVTAVTS